jgi:hypothetical protein
MTPTQRRYRVARTLRRASDRAGREVQYWTWRDSRRAWLWADIMLRLEARSNDLDPPGLWSGRLGYKSGSQSHNDR